jgi:hypothetical protein
LRFHYPGRQYQHFSLKTHRAIFEIAAVTATALLHPVFVDVLHQRAVFIGLALAGWGSYIGVQAWRNANLLPELGLRKQGFAPALLAASGFGAVTFVAMALIAEARHALVFHSQMLWLLGLYPIWGMVQQLLVQGIFVRTVVMMGTGVWPKVVAIALAALLFGAVHLPDMALAGATCVAGAVFTLIYLRWRNLWPLGLYHGWLGVFFYYWVLTRDPWNEMFGKGA